MKKVFIVHAFKGSPNGGWKPWLMGELDKLDVYACALAMPKPDEPQCTEWVVEIQRNIPEINEDVFLVGHSLGCAAILNYLENLKTDKKFGGVFFVAGPTEVLETENPNSIARKFDNFFTHPFDFNKIKNTSKHFVFIHGDDDSKVPIQHAEKASQQLGGELVIVKGGNHLSGWNGYYSLPQLLDKFIEITKQD